ncbi:unnamed protein product [Closterium sp. NIES-54]
MAEAVAVVRAKRAAEAAAAAHGEAESQFPRSTSLLEEKFDAYEQANLLIFRSKSDGAPRTLLWNSLSPPSFLFSSHDVVTCHSSSSSTRDSGPSDTPDDSFVPTNAELVTRGSRTSLRLPDSAIEGEDPAGDDAQAERTWGGGAGGGDGGGGNASRREGSGNERAGASGTGRSAEDERGLGATSRSYPPKSTRGSCWRPWRGEQERGEGEHTGGTGKGSSSDTQRSGEGDSGENGHAEGGGDALGEGQGGGARGKNVGRGGGAEEGVGTPLMRSLTEDCGRSGVGGGCPRMESGVLHETEMDEMDGESSLLFSPLPLSTPFLLSPLHFFPPLSSPFSSPLLPSPSPLPSPLPFFSLLLLSPSPLRFSTPISPPLSSPLASRRPCVPSKHRIQPTTACNPATSVVIPHTTTLTTPPTLHSAFYPPHSLPPPSPSPRPPSEAFQRVLALQQ